MTLPALFELKPTTMNDNALYMDRKPFSNTSDPRFYHVTDGARKACKNIVMGIATKIPLMTLSGDPGTGKTTLIHYLIAKTSPTVRWLFLSQTFDSVSDLFKSVGNLLGISTTTKKPHDIVDQITKQLIMTFETHEASVLVIDEAQGLPKKIIEQISIWQNQLKARNIHLSILFSCHHAFLKQLSDLKTAKELVDQSNENRLAAMTFDESCQMVAHRLKTAGYKGPPLFRQAALSTIFHLSGGNPRRIVTVCDLVIFTATAHLGRAITAQDVRDISAYIFRIMPQPIEQKRIDPKHLRLHHNTPKRLPVTVKRGEFWIRFAKRQWISLIRSVNDYRKIVIANGQKIVTQLRKNRPIVRLPSKSRRKWYIAPKQQLFWPWGWVASYLIIIIGLGYVWLSSPITFVSPTTVVSPLIPEKISAKQLIRPVGLNEAHARFNTEKRRQPSRDTKKTIGFIDQESKQKSAVTSRTAAYPLEDDRGSQMKPLAPIPSRALPSFNSVNAAFKYQDRLYLKTNVTTVKQRPLLDTKQQSPIVFKTPKKPPALTQQLRSLQKPPVINEASKQGISKKKTLKPNISVEDLALSIGRGDPVVLNNYLARGADPNTFISKDHSLLTAAVDKGSFEMVQLLVNKGARIDLLTPAGETALMKSAWSGDVRIARWLLTQGAQVNLKNKEGWTPLFYASIQGNTELVTLLLNQGAKWNLTDDFGRTPLMAASWNGHNKVVQYLLATGANANRKDRDGWTPLMFAAFQGHTEVGEKLLLSGADLTIQNNENQTPAELADMQGHKDLYAMISSYSND